MNTKIRKMFKSISNERGSVLLICFLVVTVLISLGGAFALLSANEGRIAERQRKTVQAFNIPKRELKELFTT